MIVIGIDPGLDTGVCLIRDGQIMSAFLGDPREDRAFSIRDFPGCAMLTPLKRMADKVYIECPRIYPTGTPNPNDLIKLAVMVGRYAQDFESKGSEVTLVAPSAWKGQLPKEVTARRARARFPDLDKWLVGVAKSKQHNILDAISIAAWGWDKESRAV